MTDESMTIDLEVTEKMGDFLLCLYDTNDPRFCNALSAEDTEAYESYLHNNLIHEC